jgi:hypothetical protein
MTVEEIAFHEAGHAFMACLVRRHFARVIVVGNAEGEGGRVEYGKRQPTRRVYMIEGRDGKFRLNPRLHDPRRRTKAQLRDDLLVLAAGCAAQARHLDPSARSDSRVMDVAWRLIQEQGDPEDSDLRRAREVATRLYPEADPESLGGVAGALLQAVGIVRSRRNWRVISAIAAELLSRRKVSGRRVKAIYRDMVAAKGGRSHDEE